LGCSVPVFGAGETCLSSTILALLDRVGGYEVILSFDVDSVNPDVAPSRSRRVEAEEELYLVDVGPVGPGARDKVVSIGSNEHLEAVPIARVHSVDVGERWTGEDCVGASCHELNLRIEDRLVALDEEYDPCRSDLSTKFGGVESKICCRWIVQCNSGRSRVHSGPVGFDALGSHLEVAGATVVRHGAGTSDAVVAEAPCTGIAFRKGIPV